MKKSQKILLILLVLYALFIQREFNESFSVILTLVVISSICPILIGYFIKHKLESTLTSLLITPIFICIIHYIYAYNHPSINWQSWFIFEAVFLLFIMTPIWFIMSIIFCALKKTGDDEDEEEYKDYDEM